MGQEVADLQPGGLGQRIGYRMRTDRAWQLNTLPSRVMHGAEGLDGGSAGAPGRFEINGKPAAAGRKLDMQPGDEVLMVTPGGGGFGKA